MEWDRPMTCWFGAIRLAALRPAHYTARWCPLASIVNSGFVPSLLAKHRE